MELQLIRRCSILERVLKIDSPAENKYCVHHLSREQIDIYVSILYSWVSAHLQGGRTLKRECLVNELEISQKNNIFQYSIGFITINLGRYLKYVKSMIIKLLNEW